MNRFKTTSSLAIVTGLLFILAACAQFHNIHSLPASHPESLTNDQQVKCEECHTDPAAGTLKPFQNFSHTPIFVKNHKFYVGNGQICESCHKASFCADCHAGQTEIKPSEKNGDRPDRIMPHRGNYMQIHKIEGKLDPASCYACHGRNNNERCIQCHQ